MGRVIRSASGRVIRSAGGRISTSGVIAYATGYTLLAGASSGIIGTGLPIYAAPYPVGSVWPPSTGVASSNGLQGTFDATQYVPQIGTANRVMFTFTPSAAGTGTISVAFSGLNLVGPAPSYTVTGSAFAPSGMLPLTASLMNAQATAVGANQPITFAHEFAPGDIPSGQSVQMDNLTLQQDQESYWPDGSLKLAVFSAKDSRTYGVNGGGADTQNTTIRAASTAPNRTAAFTLQQYLAANDHKLKITPFNGDGDTNVYTISPADIVANGVAVPWDAGAVALAANVQTGATLVTVADASRISVGQSVSTDGRVAGPVGTTPLGYVSAISGNNISIASAPGSTAVGSATPPAPTQKSAVNYVFSGSAGAVPTGLGAVTGSGGWAVDGNGNVNTASSGSNLFQNIGQLINGSIDFPFASSAAKRHCTIVFRSSGGKAGYLRFDGNGSIGYYGVSGNNAFTSSGFNPSTVSSIGVTLNGSSVTVRLNGADTSYTTSDSGLPGFGYIGINMDGDATTFSGINLGPYTIFAGSAIPAMSAGQKLFFNTPVCGWEQIRTGPNCMEWTFWSFLKASGQYHCQVRAMLNIRAWGVNGPFELSGLVEHSNILGTHPYATLGPVSNNYAHRFSFQADLFNGANRLYSWGGPNDAYATTLPGSSITNNNGVCTINPGVAIDHGLGVRFDTAAGGTLPSGLQAGVGYWLLGGNVVKNDRAGVNGVASQDVAITGTGSGTVNIYTTLAIFGATATALMTKAAHPVWDAGSSGIAVRPHVLIMKNQAYQIQAKSIPPLDFTQVPLQRTSYTMSDRGVFTELSKFYPGLAQPWTSAWKIMAYGDDPGDDRVGFIRQLDVEQLFSQRNTYCDMMQRNSALRFFDTYTSLLNIRSGLPASENNGPNNDGVQYPGLGPTKINTEPNGNTGALYGYLSPGCAVGGHDCSGHEDATYGPIMDDSHLPCLGAGAYLRFGHWIYREMLMRQVGCINFTQTDVTLGSTTYPKNVVGEFSGQVRGLAWRMKLHTQAEYMLADAHPYKTFISSQIDLGSQYKIAWLANHDAWKSYNGLYCVSGANNSSDSSTPIYMAHFYAYMLGIVVWRDVANTRPGYRRFLAEHLHKQTMDLYDTDVGGGLRPLNKGAAAVLATQGDTTTAYQSPAALWTGQGIDSTTGQPLNPNGPGYIDTNLNSSSGQIQEDTSSFRGGWPFDTTVYGTIAYSNWAIMSRIGLSQGQKLCDRLYARNSVSPYKRIIYTQPAGAYYNDSTTPQSFLVWATSPAGVGGTTNVTMAL